MCACPAANQCGNDCVDLATTPHREELEPTAKGARVTSVAPVALADRGGAHGALLAVGGRF